MTDVPLVERVEKLEKTFEALAGLPDRMTAVEDLVGSLELQIVQLRTEMKNGFSDVRSDFLEVFDAGSRATEALFKETWAQMRMLHEDVVSRITQLGEARPGTTSDAP